MAITEAPHTNPAGAGTLHVQDLKRVQESISAIVNLAGESKSIADEYQPDHEAMLLEVLEAVQLAGGRQGVATADQHGLDAAKKALAEMVPALGANPDQSARLLATVREAMRDTASEWIPRLPDATLLAPERSQCIPRDGDHVVVAGVTWRAYAAIHDSMGCVVPLGPRVPADDGFDLTRIKI